MRNVVVIHLWDETQKSVTGHISCIFAQTPITLNRTKVALRCGSEARGTWANSWGWAKTIWGGYWSKWR